MKDRLTLFTKYLLDFLYFAGIFVTATLPFSIRFYGKYNSYFRNSLDKMSIYSFCIALITACRLFIYITPAVFIVILVFVIAGLFSKVLARVFDKAITYKLDNDLTI